MHAGEGLSARIRPVVVLFRPGAADIASLLALGEWGWRPVAVSNAAEPHQIEQLRAAGIELIENADNLGLARALNQGIERVFSSGADYVMLLDQDSRPPARMLGDLLERADGFATGGQALGCIGPRPIDRKAISVGENGVTNRGTRPVASVLTSGQVIPRSAYDRVGGMWNELFIDNIDHEWCFRARASGLTVLMACDVPMPHDLGDALVGPPGLQRILHRNPFRHYHIVRNTLWVQRCGHAPLAWRLVELARLAYRLPLYVFATTDRRTSLSSVVRGLRDGIAGPPDRSYSAASAAASPIAG